MKRIMSTSQSSNRKVYLDYHIAKNSGSQPSSFFNDRVREGHPSELFKCDDGSYLCRVYQ